MVTFFLSSTRRVLMKYQSLATRRDIFLQPLSKGSSFEKFVESFPPFFLVIQGVGVDVSKIASASGVEGVKRGESL